MTNCKSEEREKGGRRKNKERVNQGSGEEEDRVNYHM